MLYNISLHIKCNEPTEKLPNIYFKPEGRIDGNWIVYENETIEYCSSCKESNVITYIITPSSPPFGYGVICVPFVPECFRRKEIVE